MSEAPIPDGAPVVQWQAARIGQLQDEVSSLQADLESARVQALGVEADLEQRLGIALHQRDVWRQAHDALAREVGPNGQAEHWRKQYEDLLAQTIGEV